MRTTERVTSTLPAELVAILKGLAEAGQIESVSAFIAAAVEEKLARKRALAEIAELWGEPSAEAREWAERVMGVTPTPQQRRAS